jgi:hypothetical protein
MAEALCDQLFSDVDGEPTMHHASDADDLFGILEAWEDCVTGGGGGGSPSGEEVSPTANTTMFKPQTAVINVRRLDDRDDATLPAPKRKRWCSPAVSSEAAGMSEDGAANNKTLHISVERNRRKQMNEHLAVLRSLMPCFYVKRVRSTSNSSNLEEMLQLLSWVPYVLQQHIYLHSKNS